VRICLFVHHNAQQTVWPHVLHHVEQLATCFDRVHFVSNSPIAHETRVKLTPHATILLRPNVGYDFAAWRDVLLAERATILRADEILLTNDSIIGPFYPMAEVLERVRALDGDIRGITASREHVPHIQSYFLLLKPEVSRSTAFWQFFETVLDYENKWQVIHSYELGFSAWMTQHGFVGVPLIDQRDLEARIDLPLGATNPWGQPNGLFDLGCPYVKTSILMKLFKESEASTRGRRPLHKVLKTVPAHFFHPFHF
jgi:lipopolysaccharide biosynthesis protein